MKTTLTLTVLSATLALFAGSVAAQSSTDEARVLAEQTSAAQQLEALRTAPAAEPVALGDYRAAAHNAARLAQWNARQDAIRAYAAGQRSQPIALHFEDDARAEAQRVHAEQALAEQAAALKATLAAQ